MIKVPENETVIRKAVQEYEFYLKELQDKLYTRFMEQIGDRIISENFTKQFLDDLDLPYFMSD